MIGILFLVTSDTCINSADLGMYYLNSRFYDAEICRFINADGYVSTGTGFLGIAMFSYCLNNPVNMVDRKGGVPDDILLDNAKNRLQGLLELMEFWLPIKDEVDCPHVFPENTGNKEAVHNYFTETMYIYLINENQMWIEKEIKKIRRVELGRRPLTPIRSRGM